MSQASTSPNRGTTLRLRGALLLAALLAACGEPASSNPGAAPPPVTGPGGPKSATTKGSQAPVVNDFVPPRPPRVVEKTDPDVAACIEQRIHAKEYDSLAPRDARRKLRRLQLKAECEEQLASR
jgi:hypothetical protein